MLQEKGDGLSDKNSPATYFATFESLQVWVPKSGTYMMHTKVIWKPWWGYHIWRISFFYEASIN